MGQQVAYLKSDYIGVASKICYGKAGDKVEILKVNYDEMTLVKNEETVFHIHKSNLSFETVEAKTDVQIEVKRPAKSNSLKQRPTKTTQQNSSQQTLF